MTNPSTPPLLKMWEIALPTPVRIDAPAWVPSPKNVALGSDAGKISTWLSSKFLTFGPSGAQK